ncbi:hypothetical protein HD806DRAFT_225470 [Xylariaceae sp. AK1471]|nr:hypothetical protein HD806DRAFT_225470 [Xylariaceae sp. AK1471]
MEELDLNLGLDFDVDLEESVEFNVPSLSINDEDFPSIESPEDAAASADDIADNSRAQAHRRYLSKRPHRKSRAGCKQCKKRKVKCDEAKPMCKACTLRKEKCVYPNTPQSSAAEPSTTGTTGPLVVLSREQSVDDVEVQQRIVPVISEPLFIPEQTADAVDMRMLWFYTTYSFQSFSINSGRSTAVDYALQVKIVEHAFRSPFLMETLKGLSALHLRTLNQPVPAHKTASYQARAFEGYRTAIEAANPSDFPALLGCSLLTIAMSSQTFRDPNAKRLFIIDWMAMWCGIGLIIKLISPQAVQDSGLAALFYRPPIDMEKSTQYIPNNLLFMVTSIKYGDDDYDYQKDYYELLKYLGSLYMELVEHGFGPVLDLRVITFFSFLPRPLLPLAKQYRPRILIIVAYWLSFVKIIDGGPWWLQGLTPQTDQIIDEVGEEWGHLLRVPQMVMQTDDKIKSARLLIDNHNWTPSELDLYHKHRDPRAKTDLKLITNEGTELEIAEGHWRLKTSGIKWDEPKVADPDFSSQKLLLGTGLLCSATPRDTVSAVSPAASSSTASTPSLSLSKSSSKSPSRSPPP